MRRLFLTVIATVAASLFSIPLAWAGNPHFVDSTVTATRSGDNLIVQGKEAGLGDEAQVNILVTATALCINPGGHHPQAANKETASAEGQFPVQNGKAEFSLTLTATFQPQCSPPMTIVWTDVVVTDLTNGITTTVPGTF